jgi:hypothetical protein
MVRGHSPSRGCADFVSLNEVRCTVGFPVPSAREVPAWVACSSEASRGPSSKHPNSVVQRLPRRDDGLFTTEPPKERLEVIGIAELLENP